MSDKMRPLGVFIKMKKKEKKKDFPVREYMEDFKEN